MNDNLQKKSVLVIEDHSDTCHVLKQMLRRRGLHAECAESMAEGISCLKIAEQQGHPFSCVVSDLALSDSNAMESVESLKRLKQRTGLPIRAISGVQEPDVIEACRMARIPLILKGTSAEGIMESVLYAIAEKEPGPEIAEMIADNRSRSREIVAAQGFFAGWSKLAKMGTALGVILSTLLAAISLGGWGYSKFEDSILKRKDNEQHFAEIDRRQKEQDAMIADNSERIRKREDAGIELSGKISELSGKIEQNRVDFGKHLDRIEAKIDRK